MKLPDFDSLSSHKFKVKWRVFTSKSCLIQQENENSIKTANFKFSVMGLQSSVRVNTPH